MAHAPGNGNTNPTHGFGRMLWRHRGEPGMLIPLLQAAQDSFGHIPQLAVEQISGVRFPQGFDRM